MNVTAALLICVLVVSSMYLLSGVNAENGTCTYTATKYHITYYMIKCGWWYLGRCRRSTRSSYTCIVSTSCVWGGWSCGDCKCHCGGSSQGNMIWTRICKATQCNRKGTRKVVCNTCVRNGGWSGWGPETCGQCYQNYNGGTKVCFHVRTCTNPQPAYGGAACVGDQSQTYQKQC